MHHTDDCALGIEELGIVLNALLAKKQGRRTAGCRSGKGIHIRHHQAGRKHGDVDAAISCKDGQERNRNGRNHDTDRNITH